MLGSKDIEELSSEEQIILVSRVGYGVSIKYEGRVKTNEFHLFDLPWPTDILTQLAEDQVTSTITLSYFNEPNPGELVKTLPDSLCFGPNLWF